MSITNKNLLAIELYNQYVYTATQLYNQSIDSEYKSINYNDLPDFIKNGWIACAEYVLLNYANN